MAKKRSAEEAGIGNKGERAKSENLAKIRQQIDYYFSDFNLPSDRFMKRVIKDEGGEWFPAEVLLRFKKIKSLGATLGDIVDACGESLVVNMNTEQTHIKRIFALKCPLWLSERTIQAKGFPKEKIDMQELLEFWSKTCPDVKNVKFIGRNTGIISLSFEDKELADDWAQNKHEVTYKGEKITFGRDLYIKPQKQYQSRRGGRGGHRGRGRQSRGQRQRVDTNEGGGDAGGPSLKGGYHSTLGKRQKLSDDVAKSDKQGADQEKPAEAEKSDLEMKNAVGEQGTDQAQPAKSEKDDHEVKNAGMDIDLKASTDKPGDKDIQQETKSGTEGCTRAQK